MLAFVQCLHLRPSLKASSLVINELWGWQAFSLLILIFQKVGIMIREAQYHTKKAQIIPQSQNS